MLPAACCWLLAGCVKRAHSCSVVCIELHLRDVASCVAWQLAPALEPPSIARAFSFSLRVDLPKRLADVPASGEALELRVCRKSASDLLDLSDADNSSTDVGGNSHGVGNGSKQGAASIEELVTVVGKYSGRGLKTTRSVLITGLTPEETVGRAARTPRCTATAHHV